MAEPETTKGPEAETESGPETTEPAATNGGSETPGGGSGPSRTQLLIGAGAVAAVALVVVLIVVLTGGDDGSTGDEDGLPPNVITDEEIEEQDQGTPERALLEWWQAFQFQDTTGVVLLTSPETLDDVGENNLEDLVQARGQGLQGIEILGSTESDDTASVRAGLLTFQPPEEGAPPPDEPTASTPTTFAMGKEGDEWLFDDNAYLELQIDNLKASEEAAEEQQSDEQQPQDEQQSSDESSN
jgi:hypothetical protein